MTCTIRRCDAEATVRVTIDRAESDASRRDRAAIGHFQFDYCAEHATADAEGVARYGDTITLRPLR